MGTSISKEVEFIAHLVPELTERQAHDACKDIDGHNAQMEAILNQSGPEHKQWVDGTAEELALQRQWLDFKNKELQEGASYDALMSAYKALDDRLKNNSFLASKTRLMLCDFCVFYTIQGSITVNTASVYPSLCRWYDTIQNHPNVRPQLLVSVVKFPVHNVVPKPAAAKKNHAVAAPKPAAAQQGSQNAGTEKKGKEKKENDKPKETQQPQASQEKKAPKEKKAAPAPAPAAAADDQPDATKLDIRVGKIIKAWNHEASDKLYCEKIDVGEAEPREIGSGLREFYADASMLEGRMVLVLCNLKPRKLAGFASNGMVLCASTPDHGKVEFVDVPEGSKIGERIVFDGIAGGPYEPYAPNAVAKKKVFEAVAPNLKTNKDKLPCWIDPATNVEHVFKTSAGNCSVPSIAGGTVS